MRCEMGGLASPKLRFRELRAAITGENDERNVLARGLFFTLGWYKKEFERATMTRIGRCQIKTHNLLAMLPHGETISPRSNFSGPNCVDQYQCANVAWLPCRAGNMAVHTLTTSDPQAFFLKSHLDC
jgi:hypothetical protein